MNGGKRCFWKHRFVEIVILLMSVVIRILKMTYRIRVTDEWNFLTKPPEWPVIYVSWHNRLLFMPLTLHRKVRSRIAGLASQSRDGYYAAVYMKKFSMKMARGSSTRGGQRALRELRRFMNHGLSPGITVDGPLGPMYKVKEGAIILAEMTKAPIVPISLNAPSRWEFKSWDRTQIPKPFARVEVIVGEPFRIRGKLSLGERVEACRQLEERIKGITDDA